MAMSFFFLCVNILYFGLGIFVVTLGEQLTEFSYFIVIFDSKEIDR